MKYRKHNKSSPESSLDDMIASHGWAVQGVFDPEGESPSFAYTVGLHTKGLPEIIVFGLDGRNAATFLNLLGKRMTTSDVPQLDTDINDLAEGLPARIITVPRSEADKFMFATNNRYPDYTAIQLVWSDPNGKYPWQDGFDPDLVKFQPILRNQIH